MSDPSEQKSSTPHYDEDFFAAQASGSRRSAESLLPLVFDLVRPRSVLDVGCGVGTWLSVARRMGIHECIGVDGDYVDRAMLEIPPAYFVGYDLLQPLSLGRKFDLVMSLEVAEHIDSSAASTFVENLVRHGDVILFSAAIPGQPGTNHVNLQWPAYWAQKFLKHQYFASDALRTRIWDNPEIEYWYRQNVVFYVHKDRLKSLPKLAESAVLAPSMPISLVHPDLYTRQSNLGSILRDLPRAFKESLAARTGKLRASASRRVKSEEPAVSRIRT